MVNNLAKILKKRKLTQGELGRRAGLDRVHINHVLHDIANPSLRTGMKIARALGLKAEDIWTLGPED